MATDECGFGRWLDSEGQALLTPPVIDRLHRLHEQIHARASRVMRLHDAGEEICNGGMEALDDLCKELVAALQAQVSEP